MNIYESILNTSSKVAAVDSPAAAIRAYEAMGKGSKVNPYSREIATLSERKYLPDWSQSPQLGGKHKSLIRKALQARTQGRHRSGLPGIISTVKDLRGGAKKDPLLTKRKAMQKGLEGLVEGAAAGTLSLALPSIIRWLRSGKKKAPNKAKIRKAIRKAGAALPPSNTNAAESIEDMSDFSRDRKIMMQNFKLKGSTPMIGYNQKEKVSKTIAGLATKKPLTAPLIKPASFKLVKSDGSALREIAADLLLKHGKYLDPYDASSVAQMKRKVSGKKAWKLKGKIETSGTGGLFSDNPEGKPTGEAKSLTPSTETAVGSGGDPVKATYTVPKKLVKKEKSFDDYFQMK